MFSMRKLLLGVTLLATGCAGLSISGSNKPTEHTFELTVKDLEKARSWVDQCRPDWLVPDPEATYNAALSILKERGIEIYERKAISFQTAFPKRLHVGKGFYEKEVFSRARIMVHEVAGHYCQQYKMGLISFGEGYAHSASRWVIESSSVALELVAMREFGATDAQLQQHIENKLKSTPTFYAWMDIDSFSFEERSRTLWGEAAGLPDQVMCGLVYEAKGEVVCTNEAAGQ
jgi:hypothetical protein